MISSSAVNSVYRSSTLNPSGSFLESGSNRGSFVEESKTPSDHDSVSSSNSEDLARGNASKTCYICQKNFLMTLKRKHICKKCSNAVCSDHSKEKTSGDKAYRICESCDQEATKKEIKFEIEDEITKMNDELKNAKAANERLNREYFDKAAAVNMIEMDIEGSEIVHKEKMELNTKLLKEQQRKKVELSKQLEQLRKAVGNSKEAETNLAQKHTKSEAELEELRGQAISIHTNTEELKSEIEKIKEKLKTTLSLQDVNRVLCGRCQENVTSAHQNKINNPSGFEDPTQSTSSINL